MPRALRIEIPNAYYHVMNRGAGHRSIFLCAQHYKLFLQLLGELHQSYQVKVHAYCLMDNHYHLLLQTPQANLSRAMRHLNGVYTQRFNRHQKTDGSLFRGRFKALVIESDTYLLQVSRYIHLNPVKAKLVKQPEAYSWSSYHNYIKYESQTPVWLTRKDTLDQLVNTNKRKAYQQFVEEGIDKQTSQFYGQTRQPMIWGSRTFKQSLLQQIEQKKREDCSTDFQRTSVIPSLETIMKTTAEVFDVKLAYLKNGKRGQENQPRIVAVYIMQQLGGYKQKEIRTRGLNLPCTTPAICLCSWFK